MPAGLGKNVFIKKKKFKYVTAPQRYIIYTYNNGIITTII